MSHSICDAIYSLGCEVLLRSDATPDGRIFTGIIQPLDTDDGSVNAVYTRPGVADKRRFLLIAPPNAIFNDDLSSTVHITALGQSFLLLRAEPMRLGNQITHWECVLKSFGRAADD